MMLCWKCKYFKMRRGLLGLCYEPSRFCRGMRRRGHAPYACAICPACKWGQK